MRIPCHAAPQKYVFLLLLLHFLGPADIITEDTKYNHVKMWEIIVRILISSFYIIMDFADLLIKDFQTM